MYWRYEVFRGMKNIFSIGDIACNETDKTVLPVLLSSYKETVLPRLA